MSDDANDRAFTDLTKYPLDALPDNDSGAIEVRRRALELFFDFMRARYDNETIDTLLETVEVAIADAHEGRFGPDYVPTSAHDCAATSEFHTEGSPD